MQHKKQKLLALCSAAVMAAGGLALPLTAGLPPADAEEETPLFWNTDYSFEERAADLVSRLTLTEKVSQLGNSTPAISRLGIPKYGYWNEGLHGVANTKKGEGQFATSFPYSIAMASSWDPELIEAIGSASGDEARAYSNKGLRDLSYWCPTINMSRDPRWGRNHEGYGEDNYLTTQIATGFVNGYQGAADGTPYLKVISTLKHYAANNSEYNRENGSSSVSNVYLRDYFTRSFKDVIKNTDINSVMSAYNMVNHVPSSGNTYLLDTLLRKTFGFDGFVVSDCGAIRIISAVTNHHWRPSDWGLTGYEKYEDAEGYVTEEGSVALCLTAGCDMDCGSTYPNKAIAAVKAGILDEDTIDRALTRIFTARMKTGEFDPAEKVAYRGEDYSWDKQIESDDHVKLAEDSSTQTIVMMKNDAPQGEQTPILPLDKTGLQKVVMVGPLAQKNELGGYSGTPSDKNLSTPEEGVAKFVDKEKITYISGKSASANAYMCNMAEITITKEDGSKVVLKPTDAASYTGCELEGTSNFRFIQPGAVIEFKDVDIKDSNNVEIRIAGGAQSLLGNIEVHYGNAGGGILASMATEKTGSNSTYKTISGFNSNGSYDKRDLYVVFNSNESPVSFTEAEKKTIREADVVIACMGGINSAEGADRTDIALWNNQNVLVKTVAELNPRTICHLQTVGVMEIESFKELTPAVLWTCNNGQAQGNALARVLFGDVNPSAKLPFTWYSYNSELQTIDDYDLASADYKNGGWTYQYFTGHVSYPFGYGLSYSKFEYSNLQLDTKSVTPDGTIKATVDVKNNSDVAGKEVVQLYVKSPLADGLKRPLKQLKAFEKVEIAAGETKTVTLTLDVSDCYFWDEAQQKNVYDQGTYTLFVGPSSDETTALSDTFTLAGERKEAISTLSAIPSGTKLNAAKPGKTVTTDLTITMQDDSFLDLSSGKATVSYESNRPSVATVDENGVVTPVGKGVATITVTATVGDSTQTASYAVAVIDDLSLDDIQVNGQTLAGFSPALTEYYYPVSGDTLPTVTYDAKGAQVDVKNATSIPGDTVITLTKGDKQVTYTIHFLRRSEDYVVASYSQMEATYNTETIPNKQLYADWKKSDQGVVNFNTHVFSDLHFRATVTLTKPDDSVSDEAAFGRGWIKLRSVDKDGENNYGWDLDKIGLNLKSGVNYIDIPLSMLNTNAKGTMDWTKVEKCIFVIASTEKLDPGYTMKLEDVQIVDSSLGGVREQLWTAIHDKFDTSRYTPESAEAYSTAYEEALKAVLDDSLTDEQLQAKIKPLQDAKEHLEELVYYKETFKNFAKSYESLFTNDQGITKNESMWANWTKTDNALMDVTDGRDKYRLQMTLKFSTKDGTIPPAEAWDTITIKLRSSMVAQKPGDEDSTNREHNYGWDLKPAMLNKADPFGNGSRVEFTGSGDTVKISIPLDTPCTNKRGIISWDDVREIICITMLKKDAQQTMKSYTMTVMDPVVVDMTYVNEQKVALKQSMDETVNTQGVEASLVAAYETALETAGKVYGSDMVSPFDVYDAQTALTKAIQAVKNGGGTVTVNKEALDALIAEAEKVDAALYTKETADLFKAALAAAKTVSGDKAATQAQVDEALANLQEAKDALKPAYGDIDGQNGVTAADALMALQAATDKIQLDEAQKQVADVDGENGVTATDALLILQRATEKIASFPVEEKD